MRLADLFLMPLNALWRQKLRTVLTTLGVVFGAFVLAASLSIGEGVQKTMEREAHRNDLSRRVDVYMKWNPVDSKPVSAEVKVEGAIGEARRDRLRSMLSAVKRQQANPDQVMASINQDRLEKLAAIPHVSRVIPMVYLNGFAILGGRSESVTLQSTRPETEGSRHFVVAGRSFAGPAERAVLVSEWLAYRLGLLNDVDINGLVGKSLRLEFRPSEAKTGLHLYLSKNQDPVTREELAAVDRLKALLPGSLAKVGLTEPEVEVLGRALGKTAAIKAPVIFVEEFPVIGVTRRPSDEELKIPGNMSPMDADVLLPYSAATDLYFQATGSQDRGLNQTTLIVDQEKEVKEVVKKVLELGLDARAAIEFIERERLMYLLIFGGMTCVAGVALLVSALGIANTMLMSVLERKREIGIMKAVGAEDRQVQFIFMVEAGLIGLVGASIGLFLAWAASYPADAWVRSMVLRDIKITLNGSIFIFPPWIGLTVLVFTVAVTTLAAYYPARHAAKVDPVSALRHE